MVTHLANNTSQPYPDILELFFEDVAQIPIIEGRHDSLPLTRRIERGRILQRAENAWDRVAHFRQQVQEQLNILTPYFERLGYPTPPYRELGILGDFLDNSQTTTPNHWVAGIPNDSDHTEITPAMWNLCLYLSILPDDCRTNWDSLPIDTINPHLMTAQDEYLVSKERLITGTLRYTITMIGYYVHPNVDLADLIQEGLIGLMLSAEKYRECNGTLYQHYASAWIRQRCTRYLNDHARLIKIPVHMDELIRTISNTVIQFMDDYQRPPTDDDLMVQLGRLSQDDINILRYKSLSVSQQLKFDCQPVRSNIRCFYIFL